MYKAKCRYCEGEESEYRSEDREEARDKLADYLLEMHRDTLRSLPKEGGKSSTGAVTKGSKCRSGEGHRIKEDLTPDLKCPTCGYDYSNNISRWTASMMVEEEK